MSATATGQRQRRAHRSKLIITARHLGNNLRVPLPLRLTRSDEIAHDDPVHPRPVLARTYRQMRHDVHLRLRVHPRPMAQRTILHVDHTLKVVLGHGHRNVLRLGRRRERVLSRAWSTGRRPERTGRCRERLGDLGERALARLCHEGLGTLARVVQHAQQRARKVQLAEKKRRRPVEVPVPGTLLPVKHPARRAPGRRRRRALRKTVVRVQPLLLALRAAQLELEGVDRLGDRELVVVGAFAVLREERVDGLRGQRRSERV